MCMSLNIPSSLAVNWYLRFGRINVVTFMKADRKKQEFTATYPHSVLSIWMTFLSKSSD